MPDDNVWLARCWADRDALTRLLETIRKPGRAIQGADCGAAPGLAHPRHLDLDLTEGCGHDRRRSRQMHRHPSASPRAHSARLDRATLISTHR
jgi:hypothetical protein